MNNAAKLPMTTAPTALASSTKTGPVAARALPPMPNISSRKFFRH